MLLSSSSSSTSAAEWLPTLARALSKHGFDICHPFHTSWYNQTLDNDNVGKSDDDDDDDDDKVGGATKKKGLYRRLPVGQAVLIGNTARLWPFFQTWLQRQQQQTPLVDNPLDTFVTQTISHITRKEHVLVDNNNNDTVAPPPPIFWDYDWDPANLVSMSRVAAVSGLCYYHPTAQLAIHPVYGPWLSFRAVVVVLVETLETSSSSSLPPPPQLENPLTRAQDLVVYQAAQKAWAHNKDNGDSTTTTSTTTDAIQPWIALRDSIPIGRPYRFSQNQLLYHYTRNVDELLLVSSSSKRRVVTKQASF